MCIGKKDTPQPWHHVGGHKNDLGGPSRDPQPCTSWA